MSLEEITLWIETISSVVIQVIWLLHVKAWFSRSDYDCCVYIRKLRGGDYIYLLLYVGDILIASKSRMEIDRLKS